jgi:hypothetical protein
MGIEFWRVGAGQEKSTYAERSTLLHFRKRKSKRRTKSSLCFSKLLGGTRAPQNLGWKLATIRFLLILVEYLQARGVAVLILMVRS